MSPNMGDGRWAANERGWLEISLNRGDTVWRYNNSSSRFHVISPPRCCLNDPLWPLRWCPIGLWYVSLFWRGQFDCPFGQHFQEDILERGEERNSWFYGSAHNNRVNDSAPKLQLVWLSSAFHRFIPPPVKRFVYLLSRWRHLIWKELRGRGGGKKVCINESGPVRDEDEMTDHMKEER